MSHQTMKATKTDMRGTARNGLAGFRAYPYRGKLTLEADLRHECAAGCGRRMDVEQVCAVCRGYYERNDARHPPGEATRRRDARSLRDAATWVPDMAGETG